MEKVEPQEVIPICVMCKAGLIERTINLFNGEITEQEFFYRDNKTKERLCRRCASNNEQIYRERGKIRII
jgi:hypothetical protein